MVTKESLDIMIERLSPKGTTMGIEDLYIFDHFVVDSQIIKVNNIDPKQIIEIIGNYIYIYYDYTGDDYNGYGISTKYFISTDHNKISVGGIDHNYLSIRFQDEFKQPNYSEAQYGLFGVRERKTYTFDIPLFRYKQGDKDAVDKFSRLITRYCN